MKEDLEELAKKRDKRLQEEKDRRMAANRGCREPDCPMDRVEGVYFCREHLKTPRKCAKRRKSDNARCGRWAVQGLLYCTRHGGRLPNADVVAERTKVLTTMERFVRPYEGDMDPIGVFEMEFRRTIGRIRWYDEQLAALASKEDLIWGLTEEKVVSASEYPGTDRTYAAKVHMFEEMQRWERKHLVELEKVWIAAKLDVQKLQIMRAQVDRTYEQIVKALEKLGIDPQDERVRQVLAESILGEDVSTEARMAPLALMAPEVQE